MKNYVMEGISWNLWGEELKNISIVFSYNLIIANTYVCHQQM